MSSNAEISDRGARVLVGNYAPQPISLVRGEGCWLFDAEDNRYLDLMGGIATASLGHANPKLRAALEDQAAKLWHVSNLYTTEPQIRLAERLTAHCFAQSVFFCNSGAEANEAALKLARRHHRDRGDDRFEIIAFDGGFQFRDDGLQGLVLHALERGDSSPWSRASITRPGEISKPSPGCSRNKRQRSWSSRFRERRAFECHRPAFCRGCAGWQTKTAVC